MGVILFFVFRSMARHLRKVSDAARAEAEAEEAARASPRDETPESEDRAAGGTTDANWD